MVRVQLRKSASHVFVTVDDSAFGVEADNFVAEAENSVVVITMRLRPVDGNERHDATALNASNLLRVKIADQQVIKSLAQFLRQPYVAPASLELHIQSGASVFCFPVTISDLGQEIELVAVRNAG